MNEKNGAHIKQWNDQVRNGALQAFTHFRRRLQQGGELTSDDRQGLIDLLNATEEHMVTLWQFVEISEKMTHVQLCKLTAEKIRLGRRV